MPMRKPMLRESFSLLHSPHIRTAHSAFVPAARQVGGQVGAASRHALPGFPIRCRYGTALPPEFFLRVPLATFAAWRFNFLEDGMSLQQRKVGFRRRGNRVKAR